MRRYFLRGFLICLVPCLAALAFAINLDAYRLGTDLAGGTILVYEVNLERTKQLNEASHDAGDKRFARQSTNAEGLSNDDMLKLAAQIKRRIDPADLKNVTVRPLGNSRLEIILPTGSAGGGRSNLTAEEIEEVKRLVSQMGVLEFRILANTADDESGIQAARNLVDNASPEEQENWAIRDVPPPAPQEEFEVKAASDRREKVKYAWVELGASERESLGLNNSSQGAGLWGQAAASRNKTFIHNYGNEGKAASMVLFSRAVNPKSPQGEKDRAEEAKGANGNPKKIEYYVLTRVSPFDTVKVEGEISLTATPETDQKGNPSVGFRFNGAGGQAFGRMTERNKPAGNTIRSLAILLDEKIVSAPTLNAVITTSGQISGKFDKKSVDRLVNFLRNGALNAQLRDKPSSENTIGPTLGADTIRKGTFAVGIAFAAVLAFMLVYYRFAGFVACVALLANLLLTIGVMVGLHAAFTLPGLAGVVLMLGMAVDANVLIYERLREERNNGANLITAIRNGYSRAFPTIIDTHLTSIFTALVLYTFGNDQLKGFAVSLTVGLVISLFTSLYMTRLMFDYWLHRHWITELRMLRLFERPNFNPMRHRYIMFTATTVLTLLGLVLFLTRGEAGLNVDFRGGTVYAAKLKEGEERALATTPDGKLGFRELLDEARQKERLKVDSVRWVNRPASGDPAGVNTYVFEITYADNTHTTVTLTEKPAGNTAEQMEASVKYQAERLPDVSVEQMFLSGEPDYPGRSEGKSRYFTVRTTEKHKELVQVTLDRLLRNEKGEPLVARTTMNVAPISGPTVELTFDKPTSPSYLKDLLDREFKKASADDGASTFELTGVGDADNGRYRTMRLDVSNNSKMTALKQFPVAAVAGGVAIADPAIEAEMRTFETVLRETQLAFNSSPEPERLEVFDSQLAAETRGKAFLAIAYSWTAILLYLWFRFGNWTFGLAAVLCLIHGLCFTLGAIAACHYLHEIPFMSTVFGIQDFKIDLTTVAALLTLVGYAVSDTIVVFDRIREVRGKQRMLTPQIINDSVNQTLSRTILTATTVFLVSAVLYFFGGEGVHLFAFVMVVGVLVGTYSSIFIAAPMLLMFGEGRDDSYKPKTSALQTAQSGV